MVDIIHKWFSPGEQIGDCRAIREEVFIQEQGFSYDADDIDEAAWHIALYDAQRCVGAGRVFCARPGVYKLGRIVVEKALRGSGIGLVLVGKMVDKCRELGAKRVELGAQEQAVGFYEKCGFSVFGEPYDEEGCPHRMMAMDIEENQGEGGAALCK